jgi:CBS domain-containing protein
LNHGGARQDVVSGSREGAARRRGLVEEGTPMKIQELLEMKGREVVTVHPSATLDTVVHRMKLARTGCAVVSEDGKRVDGIIAVRDIAYALTDHDTKFATDTPVDEIMTRAVKACSPKDTLKNVMRQMTLTQVLNVPVLEDGNLCGIVSIDDVVKYAVHEMELESEVLRDDLLRLQTLASLR